MPELLLQVEKKWLETPTIPVIRLSLAGQEFAFKAGQYCLVALKVNGEENDHAFSIACAPNREYLEFATRMSNSSYKQAFATLVAGGQVKVTGPLGGFTLDPSAKNICFLSGGIGITPIRSMVQYTCREKLPLKITLLFSNRNPNEIPFKTEFDKLEKSNGNLKVVHVVSEADSSWKGLVGRIDAEVIKKHVDLKQTLFYICGPPAMVDALTNTLKTLGVSEDKTKIEHFTGYK